MHALMSYVEVLLVDKFRCACTPSNAHPRSHMHCMVNLQLQLTYVCVHVSLGQSCTPINAH